MTDEYGTSPAEQPEPTPPPAPTYTAPAPPPPPAYSAPQAQATPAPKEKTIAGILAILLGTFGVHKFYLGQTTPGIIMLLVSTVGGIITFGLATSAIAVIALVEGILYLTKSDEEFYQVYVQQGKAWF